MITKNDLLDVYYGNRINLIGDDLGEDRVTLIFQGWKYWMFGFAVDTNGYDFGPFKTLVALEFGPFQLTLGLFKSEEE